MAKTILNAEKLTRPPIVSVLERRLLRPFGEGSSPITLKAPGFVVHVINTKVRPGRFHDVTRNKGWVPVAPEELDGAAEDYGFDCKDGRVVRGDRGEEVLVKMPAADYHAIQMAKDQWNRAQTSPAKLKSVAAEMTAAEHGDHAADYITRNVTIRDTREPVPLEDPPGS